MIVSFTLLAAFLQFSLAGKLPVINHSKIVI